MNRHFRISLLRACGAAALTAMLGGCGHGVSATRHVGDDLLGLAPPTTTPPGITLVDVVREMQASQPEYLWTRLGDAKGATLFIADADRPDASSCSGECAQEFPPVTAPADARAFGDWTLVKRDDGALQWAYIGKPLYTFAKEKRLNEVIDSIVDKESQRAHLTEYQYDSRADKNPQVLPRGWNVARFDPAPHLVKPTDIGVRKVVIQDGVGPALVDSRGMTLYGYDGSIDEAVAAACIGGKPPAACDYWFRPAMAPDAALAAVGEFSVIERNSDHVKQWAYRGRPLYTFSGDNKPGDTIGVYAEDTQGWQVVMLSIDPFPDKLQAITAVGRGTVLADDESMPLYVVARYDDRWGGFNAYHGYSNAYRMGKMLSTHGCNSECQQVRRPVLASASDQPRGYWEIFDREDGTRQWAYKGFALYSFAGDKHPGIVTGNNVLQLLLGDSHGQMGMAADEFGANGPSSIAASSELAKGYSTSSLQVVKGYSLESIKEGEVAADQSKVAAFYWYVARP